MPTSDATNGGDETRHASIPVEPPTIAVDLGSPATLPMGRPAGGMPPPMGDYELIREIARGGMGVVYQARHRRLNRVVALKMVLSGAHAPPEAIARFRAEAEAAANLDHPGIVPIYEVGEFDGCPYFSMAYVDGESLARRLSGGTLPYREAAGVVLQAAQAVQYAHDQGVIHRDIKPANILMDRSGQARVTDFGLARNLQSDSRITATGQVMGTPSYMPPEQAEGKAGEAGPAADVYALGAVLYELLTGRPPFRGPTSIDTLRMVIHNPPVPPRLLQPQLPRDLETICLKCLEKDPRRRYASAFELADDLRRFLGGESISAKATNLMDQIVRGLERSQIDVDYASWSRTMFGFAAIQMTEGVSVAWLTRNGPPYPHLAIGLVRIAQFGGMAGLVAWFNRRRDGGRFAMHTSERFLLTLILAYVMACCWCVVLGRLMNPAGQVYDELSNFAFWSVLAAFLFHALGARYWGACHLFSAAFYALGLVVSLRPGWAPLLFSGLWSACLLSIGLRLRSLARASCEGGSVRG